MWSFIRRGALAAVTVAALLPVAGCSSSSPTPAAVNPVDLLLGKPYTGPGEATPRDAAGHPLLTGYWKLLREEGRPDGNLGKDLPGFALPYSEAGRKALDQSRAASGCAAPLDEYAEVMTANVGRSGSMGPSP